MTGSSLKEYGDLLAEVARLVFRSDPAQTEETLAKALESIGSYLGSRAGLLYLLEEEATDLVLCHRWPEDAEENWPARLPLADFPWLYKRMMEEGPAFLPDQGLPDAARAERERLAPALESAILILPLASGNAVGGFLAFRDPSRPCLGDDDRNSLRLLGEILANTLERRRFETFRAESQERLNGILNSLEDAVWAVDAKRNQLLFFNPVSERILGRSAVELFANPSLWFDVAHPDDLPRVAPWRRLVEETGQAEFEYRILWPEGEIRWLHVRLWMAFSVSGAPARIDGLATDITDRVEAEEKLRAQQILVARAIQEARDKEVEIAGRIQQTLLIGHPPPGIRGARIASTTIPSCGIDGDFYDFLLHQPTCFDLVVGDVMGKGIPAALIGAATKSAFLRSLAKLSRSGESSTPPSPQDLTNATHVDLTPQLIALNTFLTLCYARFDLDNLRLQFVDCGHTKTLLYRPGGDAITYLAGENGPIGFMEEETYVQCEAELEPGDLLVFYSDGLTEAAAPDGTMFEVTGLERVIREHPRASPEELIGIIRRRVVEFTGSESFDDDLTCVIVRIDPDIRAGKASSSVERTFSSALENLSGIRELVTQAVRNSPEARLDEDGLAELVLAVNEGAANIMIHAYSRHPDRTVRVQVLTFPDRIEVGLIYQGRRFNPPVPREPDFDDQQTGGFGLYLIQQTVDEAVYEQIEPDTVRLCLKKSVPAPG